jgi:hypothetical protein
VLEVLDGGVRSRVEEPFVAVILPADDERRTSVRASNFEDHRVAIWLSKVVSPDNDAISNGSVHVTLLSC